MIVGYLGLPGAGKTYNMVRDAWMTFRKEPKQIYTNMAGFKCPEAIYISGLDGLLNVGNGLVLLDEAGVSLSSRYWQGVSRELLMRFAQVRKNGLDLHWTAQHENRVDTVLREITNEYVRCSRVGKMVMRARALPEAKKGETLGRNLVRLDPEVYRLYDTFEVIAIDGSSAGRGAAALSSVARRRASAEHVRREAVALASRIPLTRLQWWHGGPPYHQAWTREARAALATLRHAGVLHDGVPVSEQVQRELQRRRWLKSWGLVSSDAPLTCDYDHPWLEGYDPETVSAAAQEEARELAAEKMILLSERPSRRSKKEAV